MTPEWAQVISSVAIGLGIVYVAYRQYRNDRERLRSESYERRLSVYRAFVDLVSAIISPGQVTLKSARLMLWDLKSNGLARADNLPAPL